MSQYSLDPNFSVYNLAAKRQDISTIISHRHTMSIVSYLVEETVRTDRIDNIIFAGFQYMSKFVPQITRYREIAKYAQRIYVFGVPDVELPEIPNISYVPVEQQHQLTKEWFLVSSGPKLSTALVTEEVSNFYDPDDQRRFNGFWIVNDNIVQIMHEWLAREVNDREQLQSAVESLNNRDPQVLNRLSMRFDEQLKRRNLTPSTSQELSHFRQITFEAQLN